MRQPRFAGGFARRETPRTKVRPIRPCLAASWQNNRRNTDPAAPIHHPKEKRVKGRHSPDCTTKDRRDEQRGYKNAGRGLPCHHSDNIAGVPKVRGKVGRQKALQPAISLMPAKPARDDRDTKLRSILKEKNRVQV